MKPWIVSLLTFFVAAAGGVQAQGERNPEGIQRAVQEYRDRYWRAVREGDLGAVKEMTMASAAAPVDTLDSEGTETPLIAASKGGYAGIVQFLLTREVAVDRENVLGETALTVAAERGNAAVIQLLLEAGADANHYVRFSEAPGDFGGVYPLAATLEAGCLRCAQYLTNGGAELSLKYTPNGFMFLRAAMGNDEAFRWLMTQHDWRELPDSLARRALLMGCRNGSELVLRTMLQLSITEESPNLKQDDRAYLSALMANPVLPLEQKAEWFDELYEHGAGLNARTSKTGQTALHVAAAERKHQLMIRHLIKLGMDVNTRDEAANTPLHIACDNSNALNVRALLKMDAAPSAANGDAKTPLHRAVDAGCLGCAQLLLDAGADPTKADVYGQTPLHRAAIAGDSQLLQVLIVNGAPAKAEDAAGKTALDLALQYDHRDLVEILERVQ